MSANITQLFSKRANDEETVYSPSALEIYYPNDDETASFRPFAEKQDNGKFSVGIQVSRLYGSIVTENDPAAEIVGVQIKGDCEPRNDIAFDTDVAKTDLDNAFKNALDRTLAQKSFEFIFAPVSARLWDNDLVTDEGPIRELAKRNAPEAYEIALAEKQLQAKPRKLN